MKNFILTVFVAAIFIGCRKRELPKGRMIITYKTTTGSSENRGIFIATDTAGNNFEFTDTWDKFTVGDTIK